MIRRIHTITDAAFHQHIMKRYTGRFRRFLHTPFLLVFGRGRHGIPWRTVIERVVRLVLPASRIPVPVPLSLPAPSQGQGISSRNFPGRDQPAIVWSTILQPIHLAGDHMKERDMNRTAADRVPGRSWQRLPDARPSRIQTKERAVEYRDRPSDLSRSGYQGTPSFPYRWTGISPLTSPAGVTLTTGTGAGRVQGSRAPVLLRRRSPARTHGEWPGDAHPRQAGILVHRSHGITPGIMVPAAGIRGPGEPTGGMMPRGPAAPRSAGITPPPPARKSWQVPPVALHLHAEGRPPEGLHPQISSREGDALTREIDTIRREIGSLREAAGQGTEMPQQRQAGHSLAEAEIRSISDQVFRALGQKILIERERRGRPW
jgi:hypothetical protein